MAESDRPSTIYIFLLILYLTALIIKHSFPYFYKNIGILNSIKTALFGTHALSNGTEMAPFFTHIYSRNIRAFA